MSTYAQEAHGGVDASTAAATLAATPGDRQSQWHVKQSSGPPEDSSEMLLPKIICVPEAKFSVALLEKNKKDFVQEQLCKAVLGGLGQTKAPLQPRA